MARRSSEYDATLGLPRKAGGERKSPRLARPLRLRDLDSGPVICGYILAIAYQGNNCTLALELKYL